MEYNKLRFVVYLGVMITIPSSFRCAVLPVTNGHANSYSDKMADFMNFVDQYQDSSIMFPARDVDEPDTDYIRQILLLKNGFAMDSGLNRGNNENASIVNNPLYDRLRMEMDGNNKRSDHGVSKKMLLNFLKKRIADKKKSLFYLVKM